MLNFWPKYKTKILSAIGLLTGAAFIMGWIDEKTAAAIGLLIGSGGLATLRHGITTEVAEVVAKIEKVETKVEQVPVATAQAVAPVVVKAAALVAQETVAAAVPPLVHLTGAPPMSRP